MGGWGLPAYRAPGDIGFWYWRARGNLTADQRRQVDLWMYQSINHAMGLEICQFTNLTFPRATDLLTNLSTHQSSNVSAYQPTNLPMYHSVLLSIYRPINRAIY